MMMMMMVVVVVMMMIFCSVLFCFVLTYSLIFFLLPYVNDSENAILYRPIGF